ncbi:MAG TPA: cytosine permease [Bacillota bacterium]
MEQQGQQYALKDYEREPVPDHLRKSWWQMGMVWLGIGITIAAFLLGGAVGAGLNLTDSFLAVFLGSLVLTVIASLCGIVGARTNLSTAMIARFAFGERGVYLAALIMALGSYGWFGVQTGLFGDTAAVVMEQLFGRSWPTGILILIGGVLMTSTAVFGYRAIEKLSTLAVPLMAILMFASVGMVLRDHPWSQLVASPPPGTPMPLGVAISIVAGSFMVGAVIAPDISRYARRPSDAVWAAVLGFQVGFVIVVFIGSILAQATGQADLVQIMVSLGWGVLAFVVLILAQWTTNDNNLYSAALAFSVVFRHWPKWQLTTVAGILGTILAVLGIYGQFVPWLQVLSALVPPLGGVYVADYFLVQRERYRFENLDRLEGIRYASFASWVLGALFGFATTPQPTGWGLFTLTTVSAIDAFIVAVVAQVVLGRVLAARSQPLASAGD